MVGVSILLGLAAASAPLFLSSAENATLAAQLAKGCHTGGLTVGSTDTYAGYGVAPDPFADEMYAINGAQRPAAIPQISHLSPAIRLLFASHVLVSTAGNATTSWVTLVSKPDDANNVEIVSHTNASTGVWLADSTAAALRLPAGGNITLRATAQSAAVTFQVKGYSATCKRSQVKPIGATLKT